MVLHEEKEKRRPSLLFRQAHCGRHACRGRSANILFVISQEALRIYPLALLDRAEPFNAAPGSVPSSPGFRGSVPQSAYSDGSSNQPLSPAFRQTLTNTVPSRYSQSGPSEAGLTQVSGSSTQPRVGKAALMAQRRETLEPVQLQDSGIRFGQNEEEEAGPSQIPHEVPPTYTPN